jgi:hypothetical protein
VIQSCSLQSFKDPGRKANPAPMKVRLFLFDEDSKRLEVPDMTGPACAPTVSSAPWKKHLLALSPTTATNVSLSEPEQGPFKIVGEGGSFELTQWVRLPDDDHLRATTQPGTKSVIRFSHAIVMEVKFRKDDDLEMKTFKIAKPITFSTVSIRRYILLPVKTILTKCPLSAAAW